MTHVRLFFLSFLILFLELALIRWIPAYIRPVGYFSNLILLGTFLGMGVGLMWSGSHAKLFHYFPFALLVLIVIICLLRVDVAIQSPFALFFQAIQTEEPLPAVSAIVILPFLFTLVAGLFCLISVQFGHVFAKLPPLTAYSIDITGSLFGIGLFSLFAKYTLPGWSWFVVVAIIGYLLFILAKTTIPFRLMGICCFVAVIGITYWQSSGTIWSPYYKITVAKYTNGYAINVNNLGHQFMQHWETMEPFYSVMYDVFPNEDFKHILIIGAGSGNDVALALAKNPTVESIDAVDIDPTIMYLGQQLHPDQPYRNPKVHVYEKDGRAFLERYAGKYDAIIFALTDSLTLTSHMSSVRLESFLFTEEAIRQAKNHLTDNGVFVMYNFYREQWLVDKLAIMLRHVFHMPVYAKFYGDIGLAATLLAGPKTAALGTSTLVQPYTPKQYITPATDDWPFIYMFDKHIPTFYGELIIIILLISVGMVIPRFLTRQRIAFNPRFFLFGAAFMLLETKNLVTFELLFGASWYVNAMVFTAILCSVLLANIISLKVSIKRIWILYLLLFASLAIVGLYRETGLFLYSRTIRYGIASVLYGSPIFLANLIFSQLFKKEMHTTAALGSNILGAVLGGLLEYSALAIGYDALTIIIAALYITACIIP